MKTNPVLSAYSTYSTYFVYRENIDINSTFLVNNSIKYFLKVKNKEWIQENNNYINVVYNLYFLDKIELYLINNGILYELINLKNKTIGIFIYPIIEDLNKTILKDCMTLEEFAKNRLEKLNELEQKY